MRPTVRFLTDELIERILTEAREILCTLGVELHNPGVLDLLADHGASVTHDPPHATLTQDMIDRALASAPSSFKLYDAAGNQTHDFGGHRVHFTPGSAALRILDYDSDVLRTPTTRDVIDYVKVVDQLDAIASQSTALIAGDVPEAVSDSYRLYLGLLHSAKPVVTGAFTIESFELMKDLQVAVRGSEAALEEKPLTVFSCCPTSPLKWCDVTSQNLIDCARYSIPVEFISMPLTGFVAPITLVGSIIQHTAEVLSGVVISQLARPGAPMLYGGSPAAFDARHSTTPMGAIETMMIDCSYNEIGKHLGLPTQAYISLSDAKLLDAQAGLESGVGATLAALAGINSVSGPGMLDFESGFSLEKLILDNEICRMAFRLIDGVQPRDDFPALPLFRELIQEQNLLTSEHTLLHLREEHCFPGPTIDRKSSAVWRADGATTLKERAHREIERHLTRYSPPDLPDGVRRELTRLMQAEARRYGQDHLPEESLKNCA